MHFALLDEECPEEERTVAVDFAKLQEIFLIAVEQHRPEDWDAYLNGACAGDDDLRRQVNLLLKAHLEAGSVPGAATCQTDQTDANPIAAEAPGARIGPYKLVEQIGEGGMGTVWMAQQIEPVKRVVALKLIKAGMNSKQLIARFEAERQALAMMDHANIARVLDAGTDSAGRPYFVMDLVKGVPITRHCDEQHLTTRQRLELFIPVCQAVQHAHQKGIIHRDLKPSNVLVALYDGKPVPKVIDFGVAKAFGQTLTEKTLVTGFGSIVGTLEYMSPEQAETNQLDIDTRSDIYSLGVVLYELLTGSPPFTRQELEEVGMLEMLRLIREQEPSKPSTRLSTADGLPTLAANRGTEPAKLKKLVRGELDWIVMKALEKDRGRRYEAANGLAMDLQRYLADEQVLACPPSAAYRLRKFARRHKAGLAMAGLVLFFLVLLGSGVGWTLRDRTAREREIAQDRATRQAVIKERVTLALEEAHKLQQEGQWRAAHDAAMRAEALSATGDSDEETHQRAREVLGNMQMLANLEDVRARSTTNEAGFDLKEEDRGTTRAFREYGIDIDALDRDEAARRIRAKNIRYELAVFLDSWSHVRRRLAQQGSKQIGKNWKELLEVARAADPDPWRDRFRTAVLNNDRKALVEIAALAPIQSLPVETVDRLGDALLGRDTIQEAAAFLKKGQRLHPQDYWINVNLANCLSAMGQVDEAIRYYTAAVALRPEAALSHSNLGNALATRGKLEEAAACYRKAIEISPKRSSLYNRLGAILGRQGKTKEASAAYREEIRLKTEETIARYRAAVRRNPDDRMAHYNIGVLLGKQGKLDEAMAAYKEVLRRKPDLLAAKIVNNLAWDFVACSDPKTCHAKQAVELVELAMAENPIIAQKADPELLVGYVPLLLLAGDTDKYRRQCDHVIGKHGDTEHPRTAYLVARICVLGPDAAPDPAKLVEIAERAVKAQPIPHYLHTLGLAHYRAGQFDKAVEQLEKSIKGNWKANAANWLVLAMAHQRMGQADEARNWFDKAVQWLDNARLETPTDSIDPLRSLHPHDSLACMVLRREAEKLLGLQPRSSPEGKKSTGPIGKP